MTLDEMNAFNDEWLKGWTDKDIDKIVSMYSENCSYWDAACGGELTGRVQLRPYLESIFPHIPVWEYKSDVLWPMDTGYCARWFCTMGDKRLRGFDLVQLRDGEIFHNEVYTHEV